MIWFGLGDMGKIVLIFLGCLLPVTLGTYNGIRGVDRVLVWSARSLGARPREILLEVMLPAALPQILTGLRTATAFAFLLMVASELIIANNGLGYLIGVARRQRRVSGDVCRDHDGDRAGLLRRPRLCGAVRASAAVARMSERGGSGAGCRRGRDGRRQGRGCAATALRASGIVGGAGGVGDRRAARAGAAVPAAAAAGGRRATRRRRGDGRLRDQRGIDAVPRAGRVRAGLRDRHSGGDPDLAPPAGRLVRDADRVGRISHADAGVFADLHAVVRRVRPVEDRDDGVLHGVHRDRRGGCRHARRGTASGVVGREPGARSAPRYSSR